MSCDSVSQRIVRSFSSPKKTVAWGTATDIDIDVSVAGYKPLCIVEAKSNHAGSCCLTQFGLKGSRAYATAYNMLNNKKEWNDLAVTVSVLYERSID